MNNVDTKQFANNVEFSTDDPDGSKAREEVEKLLKMKTKKLPSKTSEEDMPNTKTDVTTDVSFNGHFVGLDLSLTGTGFCWKHGATVDIETISTKPKDYKNDLDRLAYIRDTLLWKIPADVRMVCIEDFFTPSNKMQLGSAIKLAMLGTVIRMALNERGIPFVIIAPSQLKKFVTGKGTGDKSMILREVYKRWGINAGDDNQADATVLAYLAEALVSPLTDDTPKFQVEVVKTVRKERPRYNIKDEWGNQTSQQLD